MGIFLKLQSITGIFFVFYVEIGSFVVEFISIGTQYTLNWTTMTIAEAQQRVDEWIKTIGVRYFNELTNMTILTEEVGELARIMSRKYGEQSFKEGENQDPAEEMADILWVLICLANQTGVDLTKALEQSFDKKTKRDKERHKNNEKLRG